jgi:t-SNARE complex subunit (syntaxin)
MNDKQIIEQILKLLEGKGYPETQRLIQEVDRFVVGWSTFKIHNPEKFKKQFDAIFPDSTEESE